MNRRFSITKRIAATGALALILSSCSAPIVESPNPLDQAASQQSKANLSCKDVAVLAGKTVLFVRDMDMPAYSSKGTFEVDLSYLNIEGKKPLDFSCNSGNELIVVTPRGVSSARLTTSFGTSAVFLEPIVSVAYQDTIEYKIEGTEVIAGGILKDPLLPWDKTPVVTVTNTGIVQVGLYGMHTFETGEHDRFLYDLRTSKVIPEEQRWPEGVGRAVAVPLDTNNFLIIPLGEPGNSVRYFYIIHYTGKRYGDLADVEILTMDPGSVAADLKNIVSATNPFNDPAEGKGWTVAIEYETASGRTSLLAVLLPNLKEVFGK